MRIEVLRCGEETELHVWSRHRVEVREIEEAAHRSRLVLRGRAPGVYEVYGRTDEGRFLMVAIRYLGKGVARVITAREMSRTERRRCEKRTAH
jgi:uncharacterized protein